MPGPEVQTLKKVPLGSLSPGNRFCYNDRWYEWRRVSSNDTRMVAYFLNPNNFRGAVTKTGHILDTDIQVEV